MLLVALALAAAPSAPDAASHPGGHRGAGDAGVPSSYDNDGGLCSEKVRKRLIVRDGARVLHDLDVAEAMRTLGARPVAAGRHAGQPGLALADLAGPRGDKRGVEVVPCAGEPLVLSSEELWASPARYFLVAASRGALKLMDTEGDAKKPVRKNIAEIRLVSAR